MATITAVQGARTSLNVTGLSTLASGAYCVSDAINNTANDPLDVLVEVAVATTNTPAGNKQVVVFAKASLDGTNYQSGPESGTTTTDEPDLTPLGVVPLNTATNTHRKVFSLATAFGGNLPAYAKIVFKDDLGVALTSGTVYTAEVTGASA